MQQQADFATRQTLDALCREVDVLPRDLWTMADALELVQALDYICDGDFVQRLIGRGKLPPLAGGKWIADSVYLVIAQLEARRLWKPEPSRHCPKKSPARLAMDTGDCQLAKDGEQLTAGELSLLLSEGTTPGVRETVLEALLHKLRSLGVQLW